MRALATNSVSADQDAPSPRDADAADLPLSRAGRVGPLSGRAGSRAAGRGSRAHHRGARADARARALVRRLVAAAARRSSSSPASPLADRLLAFDPDDRRRARRGRLPAVAPESPSSAARLVHAGHAGHALRHPGRHGRRRRARQEPPRRRLLRRARAPRCACASPTAASSSAPTTHERELFRATLGGMGLTGHILEVEFRMQRIPSPWIWQESERVPDIDALLERAARRPASAWPFTVGWADFLGAGAALGRGMLDEGPLGRARTKRRPRRRAGRRRAGAAVRAAELAAAAVDACASFNWLNYWQARRARAAPASSTRRRSSIRSTSSATGTASTAGAASPSTSACCRRAERPCRATGACSTLRERGGTVVPVRDQGLRPRGQGHALVSEAGHLVSRSTFPIGARHAGAGRRAQRGRDRRGRAHLSGQGRVHARRAFPRHGAAPRCLDRGAPQAGIRDGRLRSAQSVRVLGDRAVKVVFLGATKGMGRALARLMARARRRARSCSAATATISQRSAADLQISRRRGAVGTRRLRSARARDLRAGARRAPSARSAGSTRWSSPPACSPPRSARSRCRAARPAAHRRLHQHRSMFCERRASACSRSGGGTLCVFSSVAGDAAASR